MIYLTVSSYFLAGIRPKWQEQNLFLTYIYTGVHMPPSPVDFEEVCPGHEDSGVLLKKKRNEGRYTRKELTSIWSVDETTIYRWELHSNHRQKRYPDDIKMLRKIKNALRMNRLEFANLLLAIACEKFGL